MAETSETDGITLCLSGGGLRATYFHLGVIWALRQLGRLKEIKKVYSVSGGSITAAHLAINWAKYTGSDGDAIKAAEELVALSQRDVRGRVIRRAIACFPFSIVNALLCVFGKQLIPVGRTDFLEREYKTLFPDAKVSLLHVDGGPEFFILGTNLLTGDVCVFSSGGYSRGEARPFGGEGLPLAKAVAASSAYPPLFPPVRIRAHDVGAEPTDFNGRSEDLVSDAGVFDNLGYDVIHGKQGSVIISDAGGRFDLPPNRRFWGIISRTSRAIDILMKRAGDKSLLNIATAPNAKRIQIGKQGAKGRLTPEAEASVARIRTDLDKFDKFVTSALIQNGYRNALHVLSSSMTLQSIPFLPVDQVSNERLTKSNRRTYWSLGLTDLVTLVLVAYAAAFTYAVFYLPFSRQWEALLKRVATPVAIADAGGQTPTVKNIKITDTPKDDAPAYQKSSQTSLSEQASLQFENRTQEPVLIYWTDFGGDENQTARIEPGHIFDVETQVGHLWIAKTATGKVLLRYAVQFCSLPRPVLFYLSHTIKSGDTFSNLALKYYGDGNDLLSERIQSSNPGLTPRNLKLGQKLRIPFGQYMVGPDDTLDGIAKKIYNDVDMSSFIQSLNPDIVDRNFLPIGLQLQVCPTSEAIGK